MQQQYEQVNEAYQAQCTEATQMQASLAKIQMLHQHAQQYTDLTYLRAQLQPNTPCQLCGAHEHPYVDADVTHEIDGMIKRYEMQQSQYAEKQAQVAALEHTLATLQQKKEMLLTRDTELEQQLQALQARCEDIQQALEVPEDGTAVIAWLQQQAQQQETIQAQVQALCSCKIII